MLGCATNQDSLATLRYAFTSPIDSKVTVYIDTTFLLHKIIRIMGIIRIAGIIQERVFFEDLRYLLVSTCS